MSIISDIHSLASGESLDVDWHSVTAPALIGYRQTWLIEKNNILGRMSIISDIHSLASGESLDVDTKQFMDFNYSVYSTSSYWLPPNLV